MDQNDLTEFITKLFDVAELFNRELSETQAELYYNALSDLPVQYLLMALDDAIRYRRYFPLPVELREAATEHRHKARRALQETVNEFPEPEKVDLMSPEEVSRAVAELMQKFDRDSKRNSFEPYKPRLTPEEIEKRKQLLREQKALLN